MHKDIMHILNFMLFMQQDSIHTIRGKVTSRKRHCNHKFPYKIIHIECLLYSRPSLIWTPLSKMTVRMTEYPDKWVTFCLYNPNDVYTPYKWIIRINDVRISEASLYWIFFCKWVHGYMHPLSICLNFFYWQFVYLQKYDLIYTNIKIIQIARSTIIITHIYI